MCSSSVCCKMGPPNYYFQEDLSLVIPIYNHGFSTRVCWGYNYLITRVPGPFLVETTLEQMVLHQKSYPPNLEALLLRGLCLTTRAAIGSHSPCCSWRWRWGGALPPNSWGIGLVKLARDRKREFSPQMVVKSKGNPL